MQSLNFGLHLKSTIVDGDVFDVVQAKIKDLKNRNKEIVTNIQAIKEAQPNQVINDQ